jgi:Flp pilus assembly CpaF family ATPase
MKKVIRLTESELANMVRRIIREMDDEMDYESDYQKMSKPTKMEREDVIDVISDFFLENLNPREVRKIKKIMNDMQSGQSMEMEMGEDLDARKRRQRQNAGIAGGLGMAGVGALAAISHAMGYTDAGDLMVGIHDAINAVGGKYSGSIGTGMVFTGLGMALNNYVSKSLDSEM